MPPASCLQLTAPKGYFQNDKCGEFNHFICEVDKDKKFDTPEEGNLRIVRLSILNIYVIIFRKLF